MHQAEGVLPMPVERRRLCRDHEDQLAAIPGLVLGDGGSAEDEDDDQRLKRETQSYTHDYFTSKPLARSLKNASSALYRAAQVESSAGVRGSKWSWSRIGTPGEASGTRELHRDPKTGKLMS